MAKSKVVLHKAGVRDLLRSDAVAGYLADRMQPVLLKAVETAPVASGAYVNSLKMWTVYHPTRVVVRVGSQGVKHAVLINAGSGHLARALGG